MCNQDLRDKLFHALRGDALPGLKELDDLVLADIDKIMPIVEAHWEAQKIAWAELLEYEAYITSRPVIELREFEEDSSITLKNSQKCAINYPKTPYGPS